MIITALVLEVELTAQIALEFVILCALLMHLTKLRVVEGLGVHGEHFGVEGQGKARVPLLSKLEECIG